MNHPLGLVLLSLLALLGCGGGPDASTFTVEPEAPVVSVGEQLPLAARPNVDLGGEMEWDVQELYGGGLLRSQGGSVIYVAPAAAGTYHLTLRAPRRDGRILKQTVTIQVLGSSSISPVNPRLAPGASLTFNAHLRGLSNPTIHWSVLESGGGEISEDGHYTAPSRPGTYHIVATAQADPGITTQTTVVVEH